MTSAIRPIQSTAKKELISDWSLAESYLETKIWMCSDGLELIHVHKWRTKQTDSKCK